MSDQAAVIGALVRTIKRAVEKPRSVMIHWVHEENLVVVKLSSHYDVRQVCELVVDLREMGVAIDYDTKPRREFAELPTVTIKFEKGTGNA